MKILFVCTGNTCRSFMAEAIFNKLNTNTLFETFSVGVAVVTGSIASKNAVVVLNQYMNIDSIERKAVQLNKDIVNSADIILTMTENIKNYLYNYFPNMKNKIYNFNEYIGLNGDIIDPYGGDIEVYFNTLKQLKHNIELLIKKLEEDKSITKSKKIT